MFDKRDPRNGISWINRDQTSDVYFIGADETYFYIVFNKYLVEQYNKTKENNILFRYIMQSLIGDVVFKNSDEIINKIAFR